MPSISAVDEKTGRKFYLDDPDDLKPGEPVTFLLNLHGGGSVGAWQRAYFPAVDFKERYRLVVATPSAATKEPMRRWVGEADDEHLRNIVEAVFAKYGRDNIRAFWLVGHSQGGMTSNRLLGQDFFAQRVDGWLSLSGGRIGPIELPDSFFPGGRPRMPAPRAGAARDRVGRSRRTATSPSSSPPANTKWRPCRRTRPGRRNTPPVRASAWRTSSTPSPARSTTPRAKGARRQAGASRQGRERPRSTSIRTPRAGG